MSEEKQHHRWNGDVYICPKCGNIYNNQKGCPVCAMNEQMLLVAAAAGMNASDEQPDDE